MYYTVLVSRRDQSRFRKRDTLFGGESFARVLWPHAGYLEMMNGINIRFSFVYFHRYRRKVFNALFTVIRSYFFNKRARTPVYETCCERGG